MRASRPPSSSPTKTMVPSGWMEGLPDNNGLGGGVGEMSERGGGGGNPPVTKNNKKKTHTNVYK